MWWLDGFDNMAPPPSPNIYTRPVAPSADSGFRRLADWEDEMSEYDE